MDERLTFVSWNRAAEELTGIPSAEAVGRSFYDLFPEGAGSPAELLYLEALRTHRPGTMVTEYEGTCFEITACPWHDGLAVLAKDLTGRGGADDELGESQDPFRRLFEMSPVSAAVVRQGSIVRANRAFFRMLGYSDDEDVANTPLLRHVVSEHHRGRRGWSRTEGTSQAPTAEYDAVGRRKDGSRFPLRVTTEAIEMPDGPASVVLFIERNC